MGELLLTMHELLEAGAPQGLATRLKKLTGMDLIPETRALYAQHMQWQRMLQPLQQCTSLTHLDVSSGMFGKWLQFGRRDVAALTGVFQGMRSLTYLCANSCGISPTEARALAAVLGVLTQLQHLHLRLNRLDRASLPELAPSLSAMPRLQTLAINIRELSCPGAVQPVCAVLGSVPSLTALCVRGAELVGNSVEAAAALASSLRGLTRLQQLHLDNLRYDARFGALAALAPALASMPHLQALGLRVQCEGHPGDGDVVRALQPVLSRADSPLRRLRQLDLSGSRLHLGGARALAAALAAAPLLTHLDLSCLQYDGNASSAVVAAALQGSGLGSSLRVLLINHFSLGHAALVLALSSLTALTRLEAAHGMLSYVGMTFVAELAPALTGLRQLQVLDLSYPKPRPPALTVPAVVSGTAALVLALPALAGSLKRLRLASSGLNASSCSCSVATDSSWQMNLDLALAKATGLQELSLAYNDLGPQAGSWLPSVLASMPHLTEVNLEQCALGGEACVAIASRLKGRCSLKLRLWGNVAEGSAEWGQLRGMEGLKISLW